MRVRAIQVGVDVVSVLPDWALEPRGDEPLQADLDLLLQVAANANDAHYDGEGQLLGDPTETALVEAADHLGTRPVRLARLAEVPFDSARKRMTTLHRDDERLVAYTKGGADVVLDLCDEALVRGAVVPMTRELRARFAADNDALAAGGYRTLALAMREVGAEEGAAASGGDAAAEALERGLTFLGIVGLVDPPRAEVSAAIATAHHAGIAVAMVTGDHALTARAVADEIGLLEGDRVVTGAEIQAMSDDHLDAQVESIRVFARVDPEHKLRIVESLKRRGHVVAMTGDGVNDAPALKRADIGVAMGLVGTDVARDAADMVLADDDFATIVEAVRQGRIVYDNIKKTVLYLLSCNISEVLIVFIPTFFVAGPALLPLQLLWNNLITDGAPALAMGVDPPGPGLMDRAPRSADDDIVTGANQFQIVWQGSVLAAAALAVFAWGDLGGTGHGITVARTMLFSTMMLGQLLHSLNFRVPEHTIWSRAALANRWLLAAIAVPILAQMAIVYVPVLQRVFGTTALGIEQWAVVVVGALIPVAVIDAIKVARSRTRRSSE
jgi:Ca2+-transporting ATPase